MKSAQPYNSASAQFKEKKIWCPVTEKFSFQEAISIEVDGKSYQVPLERTVIRCVKAETN
jgi:hypothetical protein